MALNINALVRLGAATQLRELDFERAMILKWFPALRGGRRPPAVRKRRMSAAGKAAIRAGAKRHWAEWRKQQAEKSR